MKKYCSLVLCFVLCFSCMLNIGFVNAEEVFYENGYSYTVSLNGRATVTATDSALFTGSITIPDTLGGYPVWEIGEKAFYANKNITEVTFNDGLRYIRDESFKICSNLSIINLPSNLAHIGVAAFKSTNIKEVHFPLELSYVGEEAFAECYKLESVYFESGEDCGSYFSQNVFWNCNALQKVDIPDINNWCGSCGFENGVATPFRNGNKLYANGELVTDLVIEETQIIPDYAFCGMGEINSISIGPSKNITNYLHIGTRAFADISYVHRLNIHPNYLRTVDYGAFMDTEILTLDIRDLQLWCYIDFYDSSANPISSSHNVLVGGEKIQNFIIPNEVSRIGSYAFANLGITSVTIPNSVKTINMTPFYGCDYLTKINYMGTRSQFAVIEGKNYITDYSIQYLPEIGDIDNDGNINSADLILLRDAIMNGETVDASDINGDGTVDAIDLVKLKINIAE